MYSGVNSIGAVLKERISGKDSCEVVDGFIEHKNQRGARVSKLRALMERAATYGADSLNTEQFRMLNPEHRIFEFRAGDLRVLCFRTGSGKLIICTHILIKHGQKASVSDVNYAVGLSKQYKAAEAAGQVVWLDEYNK